MEKVERCTCGVFFFKKVSVSQLKALCMSCLLASYDTFVPLLSDVLFGLNTLVNFKQQSSPHREKLVSRASFSHKPFKWQLKALCMRVFWLFWPKTASYLDILLHLDSNGLHKPVPKDIAKEAEDLAKVKNFFQSLFFLNKIYQKCFSQVENRDRPPKTFFILSL